MCQSGGGEVVDLQYLIADRQQRGGRAIWGNGENEERHAVVLCAAANGETVAAGAANQLHRVAVAGDDAQVEGVAYG